jgi:hypothetical protein
MSNDPVILEAEERLTEAQRWLREFNKAGDAVPRVLAVKLVSSLDAVLDKYADLAVAFEPPDHDDVEFMPVEGEQWPPEDIEDLYETPDESETN